ncbi:sensor histidine kinase [Paenibacillus sp. FJAT-26967]|uniref:cache domain-containing sensor histidine kinase n=1 Tax=Paenibacillus sp. FJAT-26967 TaxID=1729690 RepID=UPI001561ADD3|nr:sensor histidine kinase [Paenibacillus sp. FJAT-26967]
MKLRKPNVKFTRMRHVNHQIFLLMILTVTLPLLIMSGIIYMFSFKAVKTEYQTSSNLILNNLSFNIDQYLQSIEKGTLNAQLDAQLQNALENYTYHQEENSQDMKFQYRSVIETFISSIEMTIKNVDSIRIYAGDRAFYSADFNRADYTSGDFTKEPWYIQTLQHNGGVVLFGTHPPFNRTNVHEPVISIARVINKVGSKQQLGVMLVDIRLDSLREILKLSETSMRNFVIIDSDGGIVYSSANNQMDPSSVYKLDTGIIETVLKERTGSFYAPISGKKSYIHFLTSPYSDWKVIQSIEEKEMTKPAGLLGNLILGLALASLGTAVLFMILLYNRVTKPIIKLTRQVKLVGMGRFDVNLSSRRQDEFGVLYQGIHKMVEELQNYIERSSMAKAQQKIAQYGALKSQINPHFLANALETIQMKAVINGQRDISEMVGILGKLFRIHIQTGKETVTLREELDHIRLYVRVQQMRFGDKIRYVENLDPGSESAEVMHFSLQPLVENAIVHGLERKSGPGLLEIGATLSGQELVITVRDDGAGMSAEELEKLRERLKLPSDTLDQRHIGIKNVHDRIHFYFGEAYGLTVDSTDGEGTAVSIRLPGGK